MKFLFFLFSIPLLAQSKMYCYNADSTGIHFVTCPTLIAAPSCTFKTVPLATIDPTNLYLPLSDGINVVPITCQACSLVTVAKDKMRLQHFVSEYRTSAGCGFGIISLKCGSFIDSNGNSIVK